MLLDYRVEVQLGPLRRHAIIISGSTAICSAALRQPPFHHLILLHISNSAIRLFLEPATSCFQPCRNGFFEAQTGYYIESIRNPQSVTVASEASLPVTACLPSILDLLKSPYLSSALI